MKNALILDWSAIIKNRLYSLLSADLPMTRMNEIEEIRFRIARKLYPLIDELKPEVIIVAKDNKRDGKRNYWREGYQKLWYSKNIKEGYSPSENLHLVNIDNKWYPIHEDEGGIHKGKAFTKKNCPKDIEDPAIPSTVEQLKALAPLYKGNRSKQEWVFEMSEEDFSEAMDQAAIDVCGLAPKGRIVDADLAEADDIGAVLSLKYHENYQHTLVTIDSDWYQLQRNNTTIYNIGKEEYVDTPDVDRFILEKIIQGDTGDGVSSTWIDGQAVNIGKTKAPKIVDEGRVGDINEAVLARNKKLITLDLDTIPKIVQKNIIGEASKKVNTVRTNWMTFTLTKKDIEGLGKTETFTVASGGGSVLTKKYAPTPIIEKVAHWSGDSDPDELPF